MVRRDAIAETSVALERVSLLEAEETQHVAAGRIVSDAMRALLASDRVLEID